MANKQWIYSAGTNSIEWKCRAVVDQYDQSTSNNTSKIKVTFQYTRARSSSYASNGETTAYITIAGTQYTISVPSYNYSYIGVDDWKTIATKTVTITHNSDGSKSIGVSCSWSQSGVQPTSCSVSGSPTLTTIPRASSVTCNDGNIGSATTINISRASNSFTHTLTYNFSGLTGTIATKTTQTSVGWTIPTSFYAKIPNAKSGKVTITCQTYSGTTLVGTKTCTANCFVVNSNPSVTATVSDVNSGAVGLTGSNQKLIKGVSNARISTSATGVNSATISSISVSCGDGKSGSGSSVTLNGVISGGFTIRVTDSRGFVTTIAKTLTLIDYIYPAITELNIARVETTAPLTKIRVKGLYWNGNFGSQSNSRVLNYYWKLSGTSTWSSAIQLSPTVLSGNTFSFEANLAQGFDVNNSYDFLVRIQDKVTSFDKTSIMGKSIPLIVVYKDEVDVNGTINAPEFRAKGNGDGATILGVLREDRTRLMYMDTETNGQGFAMHTYDNSGNWNGHFNFFPSGHFQADQFTCRGQINVGSYINAYHDIIMNNARYLYGKNPSGENVGLIGFSSRGNLVIGSETHLPNINVYASEVDIKNYCRINGKLNKGWAFTNGGVYWLGLSGDDTYFRMYNSSHSVMNGVTYSGSPSGRWIKVYSTQADDISSDRRKKSNIQPYDSQLELFYDLLKPVGYNLIDGHSGRRHLGFIAQDVEDAMTQVGMEYKDLSFLQKAPLDVDGNEIDPNTITDYTTDERIADYEYSLAYTEMISLNVHMIQKLRTENAELKARLSAIETALGIV